MDGLLKAVECKNICTAVFSSGLQLSGVFTDLGINSADEITFIKTSGESALAFENKELAGHSKKYHADGFSSPAGKLKGQTKALEDLSENETEQLGLTPGQHTELHYESGITVSGKTQKIVRKNGKILMIEFTDCSVKDEAGKIYFEPSWGNYDMAVGEKIISVFCGAADKDAFEDISFISKTETFHPEYDDKTRQFHSLYQTVRDVRENHTGYEQLNEVWDELKTNFREDWLCSMEILEILVQEEIMPSLVSELTVFLEMKASTESEYSKLIQDGFYLIKNPVSQQKLSV
jgi:phenylalanine-4-hydroxylase